MSLLQIVQDYGLKPQKHSNSKGGEWCSPCPRCGGTDRFIVQPEHKGGRYFCRHHGECGSSGDTIQFLRDFMGKSFKDACAYVGKELTDRSLQYRRKWRGLKEETASTMVVEDKLMPEKNWRREAAAQVGAAHKALLENKERLKWLAGRGLNLDAVKRFKVGRIEEEKGKFYGLKRWGLPLEKNKKGNDKRVWLPKGYLIPQWDLNGELTLLQIRMDELLPSSKMRYYPVKGSNVTPMVILPSPSLVPERTAWVIVESRFDAFLIAWFAGDLVGVMAQGSNSANPSKDVIYLLDASPCILYAMDYDEAGLSAFKKWKRRFKFLKFWPVPDGGDPGEYFQDHGGDIRVWIMEGLPPGLRISRKGENPEKPPEVKEVKKEPEYHILKLTDGREIAVTNSHMVYKDLEAAGKIVFSTTEMNRMRHFRDDGGDSSLIVDFKEIFGNSRVGDYIDYREHESSPRWRRGA